MFIQSNQTYNIISYERVGSKLIYVHPETVYKLRTSPAMEEESVQKGAGKDHHYRIASRSYQPTEIALYLRPGHDENLFCGVVTTKVGTRIPALQKISSYCRAL